MKTKSMWSIKLQLTRYHIVVFVSVLFCLGIIIAAIFARDVFVFQVKEDRTIQVRPSQSFTDVTVFPDVKYEGLFLENDLTRFRVSDTSQETKSIDMEISFDVLAGVRTIDVYLNEEGGNNTFTKKTIYNSFIENITWNSFKDGDVTVWSKNQLNDTQSTVFSTTTTAISRNAVTFAADYTPRTKFVDYQKNTNKKDVYFPIRGNFSMYVYVGDGEEFNVTVQKRDLNLTLGEDQLSVVVKNAQQVVVGEFQLADDGVNTVSTIASSTQQLEMKKALPEGIYTVEFRQSDSIVERFSTTLSKFVFGNSLFTANSTLYLADPKPVTVYTKQNDVFVTLMHELKNQKFKFEGTERSITRGVGRITLKPSNADPKSFAAIEVTMGDLLLESSGYFATNADFYFNPHPIRVMQFKDYTPTTPIDFVIARYEKPTKTDKGLYQAKVTLTRTDNKVATAEVILRMDKSVSDSGIIIRRLLISK